MIVVCISEVWKIRNIRFKHLCMLFMFIIKMPKRGEEYYVREYIEDIGKTYYILDGYPDDMLFNSTCFTFSHNNIKLQTEIEESLMV